MNILNFDSPISESSSVKISIQKQDEDIWRELNALKSEIKSLKSIIETDKKENKSKFLSIEKKISSRDAFATISDPCEIQITGLPIWDDDEDVLKNHIFTIFRVCGRPEYYSCIRSINYSSSVSSIRYGRANLTRSVVLKMCSKDVRNALINSSSLLHGLTLDDIFGIDSKESIRLSAVWPFETLRIYRKAKDVAAMYFLPRPVIKNLIVYMRITNKISHYLLFPIYCEEDLLTFVSTLALSSTSNESISSINSSTRSNDSSSLSASHSDSSTLTTGENRLSKNCL
ncbi:hypothetical protein TKK_0012358 [Trichogramma kaykai]